MEAPVPPDPCNPSPCGPNAVCRSGMCSCLPEYQGDPIMGCRPECTINEDCPRNQACRNNKCRDVCMGMCGVNALCMATNHIAMCSCPPLMTGNAFIECSPMRGNYFSRYSRYSNSSLMTPHITCIFSADEVSTNPCNPSPCGPFSHCQNVNGHAVCKCVESYVGSPPTCRPECVVSTDCPQSEACINQRCQNPCLGSCGLRTECSVINHNAICTCREGLTGNPFTACTPLRKFLIQELFWFEAE